MKFFLDSADINEIATLYETGFVDGVSTNLSLIAFSASNIIDTIKEICDAVHGPVSASNGNGSQTMVAEGQKLRPSHQMLWSKYPYGKFGCLPKTE